MSAFPCWLIGLQAKKLSDQQAAAEEQNTTLQFVQIHCQIWTKTFVQFEQIHFEIWTNTIRTIRTNTFSNLDKYISAIRLNTIFEILTNTIGNFIGLQAKKLSDQQAAAEEQNATLESFENIERCQDVSKVPKFPK